MKILSQWLHILSHIAYFMQYFSTSLALQTLIYDNIFHEPTQLKSHTCHDCKAFTINYLMWTTCMESSIAFKQFSISSLACLTKTWGFLLLYYKILPRQTHVFSQIMLHNTLFSSVATWNFKYLLQETTSKFLKLISTTFSCVLCLSTNTGEN